MHETGLRFLKKDSYYGTDGAVFAESVAEEIVEAVKDSDEQDLGDIIRSLAQEKIHKKIFIALRKSENDNAKA